MFQIMMSRIAFKFTIVVTVVSLVLMAASLVLGSDVPTDEIAFDAQQNGNFDVYLLDSERNLTVRLTRSVANEYSPAWSPDGEYLAYISDSGNAPAIYVIRANGGDPYRLTGVTLLGTNSALAWSPDGSTLALTTVDESNTQGVFLIGTDGANLRRLSGSTGSAFTPTWSREGGEIAFSWSPVANTEIWVMNVEQPESAHRITEHPFTDTAPAWSPDGREIAFTSDRDGNSDIYLMNPDGSDLRPITRDSSLDTMPAWSPDSARLVFVSDRMGSRDIFMMQRDGTGMQQLTFDHADETRPAWRP